MEEKEIRLTVSDTLGVVSALVKTVSLAIGSKECFGAAGQSVAIVLDIAESKLVECRRLLNSLDEKRRMADKGFYHIKIYAAIISPDFE